MILFTIECMKNMNQIIFDSRIIGPAIDFGSFSTFVWVVFSVFSIRLQLLKMFKMVYRDFKILSEKPYNVFGMSVSQY